MRFPRPNLSQITRQARRGAFTLAEIMVVIVIVLIVATLALPAFNVMTGAKSVEAASNVLTAALSSARTTAMSRQQPVGLAIYYDQVQQKTALALVGYAQAWADGTAYQRGDLVYVANAAGTRTYWLCNAAHTANINANAGAVDFGPNPTTPTQSPSWTLFPTLGFGNYELLAPANAANGSVGPVACISMLPESDVQYLPPGIGAQTLNNAPLTSGSPPVQLDHYLRTGVIFFDGDGKLMPQAQWGTLFASTDVVNPAWGNSTVTTSTFRSTRLGLALRFNAKPTDGTLAATATYLTTTNLNPTSSSSAIATAPLQGGMGVVLYDRQTYEVKGFPAVDVQVSGNPYTTVISPDADSKFNADVWLDQNGTLLLLNRYTGTVLKTE